MRAMTEITEEQLLAAKRERETPLRDRFAMAALTSMLSPVQDIRDGTYAIAAELSYRFADAMLEAREK
jgi:hypothetical protein